MIKVYSGNSIKLILNCYKQFLNNDKNIALRWVPKKF